MTLVPLGGFDFVQSSTPSSPSDGQTWLDTSVSPAVPKAYDAGAASFVPFSSVHDDPDPNGNISNLDTTVSSRSSHGDPDPNGYLDAPISDAGQGVDWASKTPKHTETNSFHDSSQIVSVSGSGYIITVIPDGTSAVSWEIDSSGTIFRTVDGKSITLFHRFESGFVAYDNSSGNSDVSYVLD